MVSVPEIIRNDRQLAWSVWALLLILPSVAQGKGIEFDFQFRNKVQLDAPGGGPAIILTPRKTATRVSLSLKREDGQTLQFRSDRLAVGERQEWSWRQPVGRQRYQAALTATNLQDEEFTHRFEFEVQVFAPLTVEVLADAIDVQQRLLAFQVNRAVQRVELEVFGEEPTPPRHTERAFDPPAPVGQPLRIHWPETAWEMRQILLRVHDTEGFWAEARFVPWWFQVPHDEVNFETGRATFGAEERIKIVRTMEQIREVLAQLPAGIVPRLYVAGFTDTVGTAASNQELSEARALALARAFRQEGLVLPIYWQGFGETVLARPTADEVDEPHNRRALYILGTAPPPTSAGLPRAAWQSTGVPSARPGPAPEQSRKK